MTRKRRWWLVGLCLPLVLLLGLICWVWFHQQEPTLEGKPLSEHLLKLHAPHADVRASSLEYVKAHSDVFGPYCLQLLSKETTPIQAWLERVQTRLAPTRLGRKLGVKSPKLKLQVRAMSALAL